MPKIVYSEDEFQAKGQLKGVTKELRRQGVRSQIDAFFNEDAKVFEVIYEDEFEIQKRKQN